MTEATSTVAVITKTSIKEVVLSQFKEAEQNMVALAGKYQNVAYAVDTPKGMKEAIAARADLRDNGRLFVTKSEARIKGEVNDLKRLMADETERLVAIVKPVEDSIDAQIKVEEVRKAKLKAERDRLEAERVAAHRAGIEKLNGYVARAQGHPAEAIDRAVASLEALAFGAEWEEFAAEAIAARDTAVDGLRKLAASERQRIENERLQKELADARAALAAVAAQQAAAAKLAADQAAEAERIRADEEARLERQAEEAKVIVNDEPPYEHAHLSTGSLGPLSAHLTPSPEEEEDSTQVVAEAPQPLFVIEEQRTNTEVLDSYKVPTVGRIIGIGRLGLTETAVARPSDEAIIRVLCNTYGATRETVLGWLRDMDLTTAVAA